MRLSAVRESQILSSTQSHSRVGLALAFGGLFLATLLSRLPFRAGILTNFDAVNYALALEHFDMRLSQPQTPGYPLYVLLGRLFEWSGGLWGPTPAGEALVWLSIAASGLGAATVFLAGRSLFNPRVGWIAALLLATSTVYWYISQVASPYTLDLFFAAVLGWLCWGLLNARRDSGWKEPFLWATALGLGLAGAFRLQTLIFLIPLFVYSIRLRPWKQVLAGLSLAGAVFALFFVPAVYLSGGPRTFLRLMVGIVPLVRDVETLARTTRWVRFASNLVTIARYTLRSLGEPLLPLLALGFISLAKSFRIWRSPRLVFLFLWVAPAWIVYFLIWPGNIGTILVTLPPLFLLAAAGLERFFSWPKPAPVLGWLVLAGILLWNGLVFIVLPADPFQGRYRTFENYASLKATANYYQEKLALVETLPVEGTIVVAADFRHLQYYLPAYRTFSMPVFYKTDPQTLRQVISVEDGRMFTWKERPAADWLPQGVQRIVFFTYPGDIKLGPGLELESRMGETYSIFVVEAPPGQVFDWSGSGLNSIER